MGEIGILFGGVIAVLLVAIGYDVWRNRDRYNTMDEWEDD